MKTILISDITGYKAVVIASFIKKKYSKISVIGVDQKPFSKSFHTKYIDRFILIGSNDDYIDSLVKIININDIDLFFPTNSQEMEKVLLNKFKFNKTLDYLGSYESFYKMNNKLALANLCENIGVKMPSYSKKFDKIAYPFVIKPTQSSASKGVLYINNKNDVQFAKQLFKNKEYIIQQYIEGVGIGYSVFAKNGEIVVGYGHKRLAEYPITGGSSMYRESYDDDRMVESAKRIIKDVRWSGFAMFEFKLSKNNELFLIEVNPRIWGSINQGLANGVNYFSDLLGELTIIRRKPRRTRRTYLSPYIYMSLINYLLRYRFRPTNKFFGNLFNNKADISFLKDPFGWLGVFFRVFQ